MIGQQGLIRRHHMLAMSNGLENQIFGNRLSTDQLDHDVDIRMCSNFMCIVCHDDSRISQLTRFLQILVGNHGYDNVAPRPAGNFLVIAFKNGIRTSTNRTDT